MMLNKLLKTITESFRQSELVIWLCWIATHTVFGMIVGWWMIMYFHHPTLSLYAHSPALFLLWLLLAATVLAGLFRVIIRHIVGIQAVQNIGEMIWISLLLVFTTTGILGIVASSLHPVSAVIGGGLLTGVINLITGLTMTRLIKNEQRERIEWVVLFIGCGVLTGIAATLVSTVIAPVRDNLLVSPDPTSTIATCIVLALGQSIAPGILLTSTLRSLPSEVPEETPSDAPLAKQPWHIWRYWRLLGVLLMLLGATLWQGLQPCQWLDLLVGHSGCVSMFEVDENIGLLDTIDFSPGRSVLALPQEQQDGVANVRLYRIPDGTLLNTFPLTQENRSFLRVAFSPDGSALAVTALGDFPARPEDQDNSVHLWSLADDTPLVSHSWPISFSWSLTFSPDGQAVASRETHANLQVRSVSTGQPLYTLPVTGTLSPDWTLSLSQPDDRIEIRRAADNVLLWTLTDHAYFGSWNTVWAPDSLHVAAAVVHEEAMHIRVWRVDDGSLLHSFNMSELAAEKGWYIDFSGISALAWSPNSSMLAVTMGSYDDTVMWVWRISDGELLWQVKPEDVTGVDYIAWSSDGAYLATLSDDLVQVWRAP
jgi:hypothetical protein